MPLESLVWPLGIALVLLVAATGIPGLVRSMLQLRALANAVEPGTVHLQPGSYVALRGAVQAEESVRVGALRKRALWGEERLEDHESDGEHGSWRVKKQRARMARFAVGPAEAAIRVAEPPTEVYGAEERISGGRFEGARRVDRWIPPCPSLTVVGRLKRDGKGLTLVADRWAGLLLSPLPPSGLVRTWTLRGLKALVPFVFLAAIGGAALLYLS